MRCPRADSFANPHPGGPGSPVDRHKDRSARSVLNRGIVLAKREKRLFRGALRETRFWG